MHNREERGEEFHEFHSVRIGGSGHSLPNEDSNTTYTQFDKRT